MPDEPDTAGLDLLVTLHAHVTPAQARALALQAAGNANAAVRHALGGVSGVHMAGPAALRNPAAVVEAPVQADALARGPCDAGAAGANTVSAAAGAGAAPATTHGGGATPRAIAEEDQHGGHAHMPQPSSPGAVAEDDDDGGGAGASYDSSADGDASEPAAYPGARAELPEVSDGTGLDNDADVEDLVVHLTIGLLSSDLDKDVGDDTGAAPREEPPPPPPPPPPRGPDGLYGPDAWGAEINFQRVLRRGAKRLHPDHALTLGQVVCELVAIKLEGGMTWAQLMLFVNWLRGKLPGGEHLPKDVETFKRLLSIGDRDMYKEIDACRGCGFLFYSMKTHAFCDLEQCPRCNADRYEITPQGVARPYKVGLVLCNIVRQLRLLLRRPEIAAALELHVTERRRDGWLTSAWDGAAWEAEEKALIELLAWHMRFELLTDGVQVNRAQHAKPYSSTPILLVLKNLPHALQFEYSNIIHVGFTKGPASPRDWQEVLRVVLEELDLVWQRGVMVFDGAKKAFVLQKAIVRQNCADSIQAHDNMYTKGPTAISGDPFSQDRAMRHPSGRRGLYYGNYRRWLSADDPRRSDPAYGSCVVAGEPAPKTHTWYKDTGEAVDTMRAGHRFGYEPANIKRRLRSTGVLGTSAFQKHLSYWDALHGTDQAHPPELMHTGKNICVVMAGQPNDADASMSSTGFILTAYAGEPLNAMAVRLSGVRFPSDVSKKALDVLLKPDVSAYCNSHDWLVWATSGLVPLAMLGNVPPSHFRAFQKLFSAMTVFAAGVAERLERENSTLAAAHRDAVDALVELELVVPSQMMSSQMRRLVYFARFIAKLGPAPCFWAFFAETFYGAIANGNAQRRNPEVAFAAAGMLRMAGASMYAAVGPVPRPQPKPGLCADVLTQFTSHAVQHTLEPEERALLQDVVPDVELADDVIVSRYTHAEHASRIPLRAATLDQLTATANSGIMFIRGDEVCFGHVRAFDALHTTSGAGEAFVLVHAYSGAGSSYVPWLLEELNVPCVPLHEQGGPAAEPLYVHVRDICGRFYYSDGDGDGMPTDRGRVRTLHRLVPTHYANLMLQRHVARRRRLLLALLGLAGHSADAPVRVRYSGVWPAEPPRALPAAPRLAGSDEDTASDEDHDEPAPHFAELDDGEVYETRPARARRLQSERGAGARDARRIAKAAAAEAEKAAAAHAAAQRRKELAVGMPQALKRRETGRVCPQCKQPNGERDCEYGCCARRCCEEAAAAAAAAAAAGGPSQVRVCGHAAHVRRMPRSAQGQQQLFPPLV